MDTAERNLNGPTTAISSIQQVDDRSDESHCITQDVFNSWSVDTDSSILPFLGSSVFLHGINTLVAENTASDSAAANSSPSIIVDATSPGILRTPTHLPTMLIEHWFGTICPMWSAFDSAVSYNRQLAWSSWTSSKAVFYTMQAMSAAYLSVTMPRFCETLSSLSSLAVAAINEEIRLVRRSQTPKVKYDLIYAVFTLGNSVHSTASTISENPWLEPARELLSLWTLDMSLSDVPIHSYFCQALTYWEMLLAARGRGSVPEKLAKKRQRYYANIQQAMGLANYSNNNNTVAQDSALYGLEQAPLGTGTRPNSWSGVSSEVIDVFGQVLALCHNAHEHKKDQRQSQSQSIDANTATASLCDISLAHEIQRGLLDMDFESLILMDEVQGFPVQTEDENTPTAHLLQTAEAYRQAALLQLHLAFQDLPVTPQNTVDGLTDAYPGGSMYDMAVQSHQSRNEHILAMALNLVNIIERVPSQSGARSIHLMLYLSAATGLKVEASDGCHGSHGVGGVDTVIPRSTLEVSRARQVILARLDGLRQTLPHRRVDSTIEFVKDIWKQYDTQESPACSVVYWLNIMARKGSTVTLW